MSNVTGSALPLLTRRAALQRVAASSLCGLGIWRSRDAHANDLKVGSPAPPATLVTLDGQSISTPGLLGEVVILSFWATWCAPCHEELPLLSAYSSRHPGLRVLGFSLDGADQLPEVQRVARTLSFPVGLLERSSAPGYGRIWRLPVNFTIDRAGRLAVDGWKEKKPSLTAERLEQVVTPLLAPAGAPG
ncbi:MAG TPA: TlpA disulfide reductase family protein [Steroidobacteraceae bacterium]|nr:TlpA disulfide reductase family protein [Steroidobacteraceae bacterium]